MAKIRKRKDGWRHVDFVGATRKDVTRGYLEGMAPEEDTNSGEVEPIETLDDFQGGFLGNRRLTRWER